MEQSRHRRYVVLAEGEFGEPASKTAIGVIRYAPDQVLAVIDSTRAGRNAAEWLGPRFDIPVVATLKEALPMAPDSLLLGTAPAGGPIPPDWRRTVLAAIRAGLDVVSGLHEFLADDPEFSAAAAGGRRRGDRPSPTTRRQRRGSGRPIARVRGWCSRSAPTARSAR